MLLQQRLQHLFHFYPDRAPALRVPGQATPIQAAAVQLQCAPAIAVEAGFCGWHARYVQFTVWL